MTLTRCLLAVALVALLAPIPGRALLAQTGPQTGSDSSTVEEAQATVDRLQQTWQQADGAAKAGLGVELMEALRRVGKNDEVLALAGLIGADQTDSGQEERLLLAAIDAGSALRSSESEALLRPRVVALDGSNLPATALLFLRDKMASLQIKLGRFAQAEATANQGLLLHGSTPSKEEFGLRRTMAVAQAQQGKIAEALESMLAAEDVASAAEVPLDVAFLMNFGGMFIYAKDLPRAIDYLERAERAATAPGGNSTRLDAIYSNLGIAHNGLGQLDEAQRNYERAIEVARTRGDSPANALNNLASVLMERGEVAKAKPRFEEVLAMYRSSGDRVSEAIALKNLGEALVRLGQRERAAEVFEQAHALQIEFDNRPKRLELLPVMSDNLEALGRHAEALATLRELKTLNDEAINADAQERIASLQSAIDLAERDRELAASEVERAQQEASILSLQATEERQRWLAYGLALGVIGLTIVLGLLIRENRFRERTNRALAEKNREIESQRKNLQALNEQIVQQSLRDELTRLPNRRFLNDYMQKHSATAVSSSLRTLILIIDIDHFKRLNDSHGHLVGDQALVHLAGVLRGVQRESDVMARWGGEEFLWLCPGLSVDTAESLCERVRLALVEHPMMLADQPLPMTLSIGVAPLPLWPDRPGTWSVSLRAADAALYYAKREGRDRWAGVAGVRGAAVANSSEFRVDDLLESGGLVRL